MELPRRAARHHASPSMRTWGGGEGEGISTTALGAVLKKQHSTEHNTTQSARLFLPVHDHDHVGDASGFLHNALHPQLELHTGRDGTTTGQLKRHSENEASQPGGCNKTPRIDQYPVIHSLEACHQAHLSAAAGEQAGECISLAPPAPAACGPPGALRSRRASPNTAPPTRAQAAGGGGPDKGGWGWVGGG